jgi:phosphoribosylglycinamide formyltransferase-1
LNTHPSLLPAFKGWHAVAQALESGVTETGCTVHIATEALDDGPILAQRRVAVAPDDTEETLHERIKSVERELYPLVVGRVMAAMREGEEPSSIAGTLED